MKDLVSFVVFIDDDQKSDVPNDLKELGLATILVLIFFSYAWNKDVQSSSWRSYFNMYIFPCIWLLKLFQTCQEEIHLLLLHLLIPYGKFAKFLPKEFTGQCLLVNKIRVPVVDEKGDLVNIISQSSIIAFLQKHVDCCLHINSLVTWIQNRIFFHHYRIEYWYKACALSQPQHICYWYFPVDG